MLKIGENLGLMLLLVLVAIICIRETASMQGVDDNLSVLAHSRDKRKVFSLFITLFL
jgi:hypothetical protein